MRRATMPARRPSSRGLSVNCTLPPNRLYLAERQGVVRPRRSQEGCSLSIVISPTYQRWPYLDLSVGEPLGGHIRADWLGSLPPVTGRSRRDCLTSLFDARGGPLHAIVVRRVRLSEGSCRSRGGVRHRRSSTDQPARYGADSGSRPCRARVGG